MSSRDPVRDYLAIVNPAAGGGRCGRRAPAVVDRLRQAGLTIEVRESPEPHGSTRVARDAYVAGYRNFIAVGGDGTCSEVLNGIAPEGLEPAADKRASLAVVPLGTGNSFLREFTTDGVDYTLRALAAGKRRDCDVLCLTHDGGRIYFVNLLGFGFTADVTFHTARGRYKRLGNLGYIFGVLHTIICLRHKKLPLRIEGGDLKAEPLTFLCVCNSRYTAGSMLMAPMASIADGLAHLIRVEPMGRLAITRAFPRIYKGSHLELREVSAHAARRIDFEAEQAVDMMVDGEMLRILPRSVEALPGALRICA